jgi:hypothetical protein
MVTSAESGIVSAVFTHRDQAEAAIEELRGLGLTDQEIGVAVPDPVHHQLTEQLAGHEDLVGEEEWKGAARGLIMGAPLGALAGTALFALMFGGFGPLGLGGILAGAGAGALWGMFLGAEGELAVKIHSEEEAPHWSTIPLGQTDILLTVRAGKQAAAVHDVMIRHHGRCFCALDRLRSPAG